jgi:hypothetical protein
MCACAAAPVPRSTREPPESPSRTRPFLTQRAPWFAWLHAAIIPRPVNFAGAAMMLRVNPYRCGWRQLAAAQRAWVPGGHGEKEARLFANILEAQRGRSPLPHRNAARSLTWTKRRSMSQRRSRGSRSWPSSSCGALRNPLFRSRIAARTRAAHDGFLGAKDTET